MAQVKNIEPVFIETSDMNIANSEVKKEKFSEEDPLIDTACSIDQDLIIKMEDYDEVVPVKEELEIFNHI